VQNSKWSTSNVDVLNYWTLDLTIMATIRSNQY